MPSSDDFIKATDQFICGSYNLSEKILPFISKFQGNISYEISEILKLISKMIEVKKLR